MPTGKIRFFDENRGFGFINDDDGKEAFVHASAFPVGVIPIVGQRVEYSVTEGRKGRQAVAVSILDDPVARVRGHRRKKPKDLAIVVEDLIRLLDESSASLQRGHYPDNSKQIAAVLRNVAEQFD